MRLGVYSDMLYRRDGETLSTRRAFIRFVTALPPRVDEVTIFGRLDPTPGRMPYALESEGVRFAALSYYESVTNVGTLVRSLGRSCRIFADELERLDAVWLFGPHPLALPFVLVAMRKKVPVFLGVRQDYPEYIANRLPSRRWRWAVPVAHALDRAFRLLARRVPTVALGDELARNYHGGGAPVLTTGFSLVRRSELAPLDEALSKRWDTGELRLLTVSRLDPEKNPLLLLEVIAALRARGPRWRMAIAGDGPLREEMERGIVRLDLAGAVELLGEVPNGPELWNLYRSSHAFLHVSFTEGLPQVLYEAQAAGLPIVATAVGGVAQALAGGTTALLIEPGDAAAAVAAVERLETDADLRGRLIVAGHENAERETLEAQLDRIAEFFGASSRAPEPAIEPEASPAHAGAPGVGREA